MKAKVFKEDVGGESYSPRMRTTCGTIIVISVGFTIYDREG